jgi:hypothetical protein
MTSDVSAKTFALAPEFYSAVQDNAPVLDSAIVHDRDFELT